MDRRMGKVGFNKTRMLGVSILPILALSAQLNAAAPAASPTAQTKTAQPSASTSPTVVTSAASKLDLLGTKDLPATVEFAPSATLRIEATDKTERPADHRSAEWFAVYLTGALALITGGLAVATFKLYSATVGLGRDAKASGETQIARMDSSISEAGRAASAMEAVARATSANAELMQKMFQKQMRAYVSVEIGGALFQNDHVLFQASPVLNNTGLSPARNVSYRISASIIENNAVEIVGFPDVGPFTANDVSLAPRQQLIIHSPTVARIPDEEVQAVKDGADRRLHAWGIVTYDDVYGGHWETEFCVNYQWAGETILGYYYRTHNKAT
jgi:hypothetical protein